MRTPFFIVGLGRSGTTLLQGMLNAHPEIAIPPESHFFSHYVVPECRGKNIPYGDMTAIIENLERNTYLKRLNLDLNTLFTPYCSGIKPFSYQTLYMDILNAYSDLKGKSVVGDKAPSYTPFIYELFSSFPQAYVFHIIRDPRDVILSRLTTLSLRRGSFFHYLIQNNRTLITARQEGRARFGSRYLEIRYEKLVHDPQKELMKICDRLGLTFHEKMLAFHENAKEIVSPEEMPWKQNVFRPLTDNHVGKWKSNLKKWQILIIEELNKETMIDLGYELTSHQDLSKAYVYFLPVRLFIKAGLFNK